jgi:hypothetical protein
LSVSITEGDAIKKFRTHPAFQPVKTVLPFKELERYVVMNEETQQVLWSEEKYEEAKAMAEAFAQTLETSVSLIHVTLDYV